MVCVIISIIVSVLLIALFILILYICERQEKDYESQIFGTKAYAERYLTPKTSNKILNKNKIYEIDNLIDRI